MLPLLKNPTPLSPLGLRLKPQSGALPVSSTPFPFSPNFQILFNDEHVTHASHVFKGSKNVTNLCIAMTAKLKLTKCLF